MTFTQGDIVKPAGDGEDQNRQVLRWTLLRGVVVDSWQDGIDERVQVRWFRPAPYPRTLPAYLLEKVAS